MAVYAQGSRLGSGPKTEMESAHVDNRTAPSHNLCIRCQVSLIFPGSKISKYMIGCHLKLTLFFVANDSGP